MTFEVILRSRATRAAAAETRGRAVAARAQARASLRLTRMVEDEVARARERRRELGQELGTWPYWGPPTRELWNVLVPLAGSDAA